MDLELAEILVQVLEDEGIEASLRESYSGRGMYGKVTVGVSLEGDAVDLLRAVINNATCFIQEEEEPVEFFDLSERFSIGNLRQDSMGLGMIVY
jgi:hypothetical protein